MRIATLALAGALSVMAAAADAAVITYDFTSGGTNSGSGYGNVRTFTSGGVTVTVTAWSLTGGGGTTFQTSQLGQYSGAGLGVCNRNEGTGCDSPGHQVDNVGSRDFVLFQFSAPVDPLSIVIDPSGTYDRDVSYWTGTAANPLNLNGLGLGSLGGLGFGARTDVNNSSGSGALTVTLVSGVVNSVLFAASLASPSDYDDYFKIEAMSVDYTRVPEPATLALLGLALAGLGMARRRAA